MKYSVIFLLLLLSACGGSSWWGADNDGKRLEGDRVAVLNSLTSVSADPALADFKVKLPYPGKNERWYKSSGFHFLTEQNPNAPWNITDSITVDIGSGGGGAEKLNVSPIVAKGKIYTMDSEGVISAYDASNIKKLLWRVEIEIHEDKGDFSNAGMSYAAGKIYLTTGYTTVVALNAEDGSEIWRRNVNSITRSAPGIGRSMIYIQTLESMLYAMDAKTGSIEWTHSGIKEDIGVLGAASPVVVADKVLFSGTSGELTLLNANNGSRIWGESLSSGNTTAAYALSDIDASPVVAEGEVYAISNSGLVTATEIATGRYYWEQNISGYETPWLAGSMLYVLSSDSQLVAIHTQSGKVKWVTNLPRYKDMEDREGRISWSGPVMASSRLLVVSSNGDLYSISPLNGNVLNVDEVPDDIYIAPVVAHDQIFLLSDDAKLIALQGDVKKIGKNDLLGLEEEK